MNLNHWDVSTCIPGFIQTRYLPSDGTIWEINLLKYEISPESLFRLQKEIWKKDILPNFNYFMDVWVGTKEVKLFLGAKSESASLQLVNVWGIQCGQQMFSGLELSMKEKELEPLVQLWTAVIARD